MSFRREFKVPKWATGGDCGSVIVRAEENVDSLAAEFTSRLSSDFARQVQALGKPSDVLLGISAGGRSKNVVRAAEVAKGVARERREGRRMDD